MYAPRVRLWSVHPRYLDSVGLVALWREGLLAQAVLSGRTRGYTRHPQLVRFRAQEDLLAAVARYLHDVADEAGKRGYRFDRGKLPMKKDVPLIELTRGQLLFEWRHLLDKLQVRNPARFHEIVKRRRPMPHAVFVLVPGGVAAWEKGALTLRR